MGYESTLVFGVYHEPTDEERQSEQFIKYGTYVNVVSTLDLSKMGYNGPWSHLLKESPANTDNMFLYLYGGGDEPEHADAYGETFKVLNAERLLITLEKEAADGYRRAVLALDMVTAWVKHAAQFTGRIERPVILHYGH